MTLILLILLATVFVFLVGVLTGNGYTTWEQDQRDQRQAAKERQLNDEWRLLRELQEQQ